MKFVLVNKYDEIVSRVDLGDVGLNGAKTYFKGMKKMPDDKDFDKLWKVMTEQQYDNQFKRPHYKIKGNTNGGRKKSHTWMLRNHLINDCFVISNI